MDPLLWLLLPLAAASGWWMAQRSARRGLGRSALHEDYYLGLNYLLNEQADKATEILIRMVEVDRDTVELHLALGSLFRRRGEVDRAIRVHQNIIERPSLDDTRRAQAMLELGRDYMRAGLFDRAEQLFQKLLGKGLYADTVAAHLIEVYQQEKEWEKAIALSERQKDVDGDRKLRIAHYCCELAEEAMEEGDGAAVLKWLRKALASDPESVRALVLQGRYHQSRGEYGKALQYYVDIESKDAMLLPTVFGAIDECYRALGREEDAAAYFSSLAGRQPALVPLMPVSFREEAVQTTGATAADVSAAASLAELLQKARQHRRAGMAPAELIAYMDAGMQQLVEQQPNYRCSDCGFSSRTLFWQCPGCQRWSSMKPVVLQQGKA